jgi:hypothetical protein
VAMSARRVSGSRFWVISVSPAQRESPAGIEPILWVDAEGMLSARGESPIVARHRPRREPECAQSLA